MQTLVSAAYLMPGAEYVKLNIFKNKLTSKEINPIVYFRHPRSENFMFYKYLQTLQIYFKGGIKNIHKQNISHIS